MFSDLIHYNAVTFELYVAQGRLTNLRDCFSIFCINLRMNHSLFPSVLRETQRPLST